MATMTSATSRLLEVGAVGKIVQDHPQIVRFQMANGRTAVVFLNDRGGFDGAQVLRNGLIIGTASTIKRLLAMGAS